MESNNDGIDEGAAMWLITLVMKKLAAAVLTAWILLTSTHQREDVQEDLFTSYIQVGNHLLEMYATDDMIAETDNDIVLFTQVLGTAPLKFAEALWMKKLRSPRLYHE